MMNDLGTLAGGTSSLAEAINDQGQVVGYSSIAGGKLHGFIDSNGSMVDLNTLIPSGSGLTISVAFGINDAGQIVARGVNSAGQDYALLLTPVPEPSSVVLMIVGLAGATAYVRRAASRSDGAGMIPRSGGGRSAWCCFESAGAPRQSYPQIPPIPNSLTSQSSRRSSRCRMNLAHPDRGPVHGGDNTSVLRENRSAFR